MNINMPIPDVFTTCDLCGNKDRCLDDGVIINVKTANDYFDHYFPRIDKRCIKIPETKNN
jgi:hypothetical protein